MIIARVDEKSVMWTSEKLNSSIKKKKSRKITKLIASHDAPFKHHWHGSAPRCRQRNRPLSHLHGKFGYNDVIFDAFGWRTCSAIEIAERKWNKTQQHLTLGWKKRAASTLSTAGATFSLHTEHCERNSINGNFSILRPALRLDWNRKAEFCFKA